MAWGIAALTRVPPGCTQSARRRRRAAGGCAGCHPASAGGWVAEGPMRCSAAPQRSAHLPPAKSRAMGTAPQSPTKTPDVEEQQEKGWEEGWEVEELVVV